MKLKALLLAFISLYMLSARTHVAVGQESCEPTLPTLHVDTTYPTPTGPTICVGGPNCTQQNLQAAINEAAQHNEGATVEIYSTATFNGTITLPNRPMESGWIIIRTSNMAGIPAAETRVAPLTHATAMPKIVVSDDRTAVATAMGTSAMNYPNHYRLVGLEIKLTDSFTGSHTTGLVKLGAGTETSADLLPSHVIVDRCFIHGTRDANLKRGVGLDSKSSAVIDSYISECHLNGNESQAILGYNGPGPFKVVNNYLEAAGENLFFGGAPRIPNLVPSDIEIRRNYLRKQPSWRDSATWNVKNLLEFKSGQRVLIDGNILEYNWIGQSDQHGTAVVFKSTNEGGNAPYNVTQEITFTNNIVRHASRGITIAGRDGNVTSQTQSIKIANNLFDDVNSTNWGGDGIFLQVTEALCITLDHNSAFHNGKVIYTYGVPTSGFVYKNNLTSNDNAEGVQGDSQSQGSATLAAYMPNYVFVKNVIPRTAGFTYPNNPPPNDNYYPATLDGTTYVGTDGKNVGVDQYALDTATSGTISGVWTGGLEEVIWTNYAPNATPTGSTLKKTSGSNTVWDAGGVSSQSIPSGAEGYVEFSAGENSTGKACGLNSDATAGQGYLDIDFAISLGGANLVRVFENGSQKGVFGNYNPTERYRVAIEMVDTPTGQTKVVNYYRNDVVFYTNTNPILNSTLYVDASLQTLTPTPSSLTNVKIFVSSPTIGITWQNVVGVSISGNTLTKIFNTSAWDAGASSAQMLTGDGYVEFMAMDTTSTVACGLNAVDTSQTLHDLDYAIYLNDKMTSSSLRIYEKGLLKKTVGTYVAGEKFRVAIEGASVNYYRVQNGVVMQPALFSSPAPTTPVVLDTSLYSPGSKISNVVISGAWSN